MHPNSTGPLIIVIAGDRGRDWISITSAVYLFRYLLTQPFSINFKWYIIAVANPDGYYHSGLDRDWEKNFYTDMAGRFLGVNLDRNWGY